MNAEFIEALNALEKERGIKKAVLLNAFEFALVNAYKRNYDKSANVRAEDRRRNGRESRAGDLAGAREEGQFAL